MFDSRLSDLPPEILVKIAQIDQLKGEWISGGKLNPEVLKRLKQSVLVTSSGSSTRIEGSKLSDEAVEKLMTGIAIQKFADRDSQEVQGYFELLQNVFNSWQTIKFGESNIKHFHKELLKYVEKDKRHRGEYKKTENRVEMINSQGKPVGVLFATTPAYLTPKSMQELVEWTEEKLVAKKYHPLLIIGNFLVEFLNIHPFTDGNGRLSRILTNLLLLQAGYIFIPYISHEKIIEDQKSEYYLALRKSQKTFRTKEENLTPWLVFFLDVILIQAKLAIGLLSTKELENILSKKQLVVWQYLEKIKQASPKEISQKTKIARPTVGQALSKLLKLKRICRIGLGRATRYEMIK